MVLELGTKRQVSPRRLTLAMVLGATLLVGGLAWSGCVARQLFGTNWVSHRAQARTIERLEESWKRGERRVEVEAGVNADALIRRHRVRARLGDHPDPALRCGLRRPGPAWDRRPGVSPGLWSRGGHCGGRQGRQLCGCGSPGHSRRTTTPDAGLAPRRQSHRGNQQQGLYLCARHPRCRTGGRLHCRLGAQHTSSQPQERRHRAGSTQGAETDHAFDLLGVVPTIALTPRCFGVAPLGVAPSPISQHPCSRGILVRRLEFRATSCYGTSVAA